MTSGWTTRYVDTDTVRIQYLESGNPQGTPLILVHGFPDSPVAWDGVLHHLDLNAFRVIAPFLRGYGGSSVKDPSFISGQGAALANDLLDLADALHIDRFHLVGHDWGAKTSYGVAVLVPHRIRSLTTLATSYVIWKGELYPPAQVHGNWYQFYFQVDAAEEMLDAHSSDFCKELWSTWSPTYRFTDTEFDAAAEAWSNPQFTATVLDYYRIRWGRDQGNGHYAREQNILDQTPKPAISVPTLFIQGDADACDLVDGADGQDIHFTNGYDRLVIAGVGHFPHRENPGAVGAAIEKHMAAHSS